MSLIKCLLFLSLAQMVSASSLTPLGSVKLPSAGRAVSIHTLSKQVAVPMALEGLAIVRYNDEGFSEPEIHEWPTLDVEWISEDEIFIAGRFHVILRATREEADTPFAVTHQWPTEGIVNDLEIYGDQVIASSGAVGILLYQRDGEELRLRARHPLVDFTRQTVRSSSGLLFAADGKDTGLQILSQPDITRLKNHATLSLGFVDAVEHLGDLAVVGSRFNGTYLINADNPEKPRIVASSRLQSQDPFAQVFDVDIHKESGRILVSEGKAGLKVLRYDVERPEMGLRTVAARSNGKTYLAASFVDQNTLITISREGDLELIQVSK